MKNSLLLIAFLFAFIEYTQAQIEKVEEMEHTEDIATDPQFENVIWDPEHFYSHKKEIALDFTPLISKLAPFNLGQTEFGRIGFKYKRYGKDMGFRLNFGASLENNNEGNNGDDFAYLSVGFENRRILTPKFSFITGWDVFISFEESDNPFDDNGAVGVANAYGFEYNFNEVFYMSTEAQIQVASSDGELSIKMVIPQGIFLGTRF